MAEVRIKVPDGMYCWEFRGGEICEYFNNEYRVSRCELFRRRVFEKRGVGYEKVAECTEAEIVYP